MKSYTDISQSKKLAEILPHNTADGTWKRLAIAGYNLDVPEELQYFHDGDTSFVFYSGIGIPSWSLAALLDNIPQVKLDNIKQYDKKYWRCCAYFASDWHNSDWCDNPVDACVELIIKLHEQKLL